MQTNTHLSPFSQDSAQGQVQLKKVRDTSKVKIEWKYEREKYLRYGDYVLLRGSDKPSRYLSGRSVVEESVYVLEKTGIENEINQTEGMLEYPGFSELLFAIYPNYYYEASKAYDKFKQTIEGTDDGTSQAAQSGAVAGAITADDLLRVENLSGKQQNKFETLRKRREAETEINSKRVGELRGQLVTIGAEVQLYHVYSGSFLKATREKSEEDQSLFHVKLTRTPSSATHFLIKINPYLNYKKEGEKIGYDEMFFFENIKYHSVLQLQTKSPPIPHPSLPQLTFPESQTTPAAVTAQKKLIQEQDKAIQNYKSIPNELRCPPTLEQMTDYARRLGGHKKPVKENIDTFQAIFIKKPSNDGNEIPQILWGDFVRLKHILRQSKKKASIHVESNVCGFAPNVFAVIREEVTQLDTQNSICDIFQVLPEQETDLGQPVTFDNPDYGQAPLRLRHLLTGRYLQISQETMTLSKTFDEELMDARKKVVQWRLENNAVPSKQQAPTLNKDQSQNKSNQSSLTQIPMQKSSSFLPQPPQLSQQQTLTLNTQTSQNNLNNEGLDMKQSLSKDQQNSQALNMGIEVMEEHLSEFRRINRLIVQNVGRDEPFLHTTTAFQIRNSENLLAKVNESEIQQEQFVTPIPIKVEKIHNKKTKINKKNGDKFDYSSMQEQLCSEDYFKPWFLSMDALHRKYFPVSADENEGDFFFLDAVPEQTIADYNTLNCQLDPFIQLCNSKDSFIVLNHIIENATQNLNLLGLWLCDIQVDAVKDKIKLDQVTANPSPVKQAMLREIGLLDMLLKIVLQSFRQQALSMDVIENNFQLYQFIQTMIDFLMKVCFKHSANSLYVISWYKLFKRIILDPEAIMEFKFDKLVSQLFQDTNINISFEEDLREIALEINYEDINLNALNLLLSFCKYNPSRKKKEVEDIVQFIVEDEKIRNNIFRAFKTNADGDIYFELEENGNTVDKIIGRDFEQTQKNLYQYSIQVVNLTTELCKGGPSLILNQVRQLFDPRICHQIISNEDMPAAYRAIFLNLLKECYLANDFKYMLIETLPSLVKIKNRSDFEETMLHSMFLRFKESVSQKYFSELDNGNNSPNGSNKVQRNGRVNLKVIIDSFLRGFADMTFKEQSENKESSNEVSELANAILSLCIYIIKRGFYSEQELQQLEKTMYDLLQQAYAFRKIKSSHKGIMKDKIVGGVKVTKNIHMPAGMVKWVATAIDILSYLEDLRLEQLVERLFQDARRNKYFGDEDRTGLNITGKEVIGAGGAGGIDERNEKLSEFLETEQSRRNIKNTFVLTELLLLDSLELKRRLVDLVNKQFSTRKRYLSCLNATLAIDISNSQVYFSLHELYFIMHFSLVDVQFVKSSQIYENHQSLDKMAEAFKDLITFLFDENPPDDLVELASFDLEDGNVQANPVKPSIQTHQRDHFFQSEIDQQQPQLLEDIQLDINSGQRNSGILNMITSDPKDSKEGVGLIEQVKKDKSDMNLTANRSNMNLQLEIKTKTSFNKTLEMNPKDKTQTIELAELSPELQMLNQTNKLLPKKTLTLNQSSGVSQVIGKPIKNPQITENLSKVMYSIMDTHYIDINQLYPNQRILRSMEFYNLVIDVLLTFGEKQGDKHSEINREKNNIVRDCLMTLIYFTLQNEENQEKILNHQHYPKLIESIFNLRAQDGMLELTFILVSQIYKDNYSILLSLGSHFSKQGRFVLKCLFSNFFEQAAKQDKAYCIYFFQFLKFFFTVHGKTIPQNQTLLLKIFQDDSISGKSQIQTIITDSINFCCFAYLNPIGNRLHFEKQDDYIIKIPQEAILLQQMLYTFRQLAKGAGLAVNTFVRIFFSLDDIKIILKNTSWNPALKTEALDFLVEVYLNSKNIESSEYQEIQNIITEILIIDIQQYQEFTKATNNNAHNQEWKCKGDALNIFEGKNPFGTLRYLVCMNYIYGTEYYIMNSIVPCLQSFINKLPELPSDLQFQLVSQMETLCKQLQQYWDKEEEQWKLMLEGKFKEDKDDKQDDEIANLLIGAKPSEKTIKMNTQMTLQYTAGMFMKSREGSSTFKGSQTLKGVVNLARKMYSKKVDGNQGDKKQRKADMIQTTQKALRSLFFTEKFKDVSNKQQNVVTSYNQEAAFIIARQNRPAAIFTKVYIENEQEGELEVLISTLIEVKIHDQSKFRAIVESLITVLSSEQVDINVRMTSMKMLRKLSNYKADSKVNESIQHDLIAMGFLRFLCDVIAIEPDPQMKLEYIRGLVDFMEESNREIQDSFFCYLQSDKENKFLNEINNFLMNNFNQTKNTQALMEEKGQHLVHFRKIINFKQEICLKTLELLRLSTENHYRLMQDFLREQTDPNGQRKSNNLNMINQLTGMFERYRKAEMQSEDFTMGIKILDTLIEWIQGPCEENQLAICHTNLLENLEDIQYDLSRRKKFKSDFLRARSEFNQKTILMMRSLFEGNFNPFITKKVAMYVDANLMIETIVDNYKQYSEYTKNIDNIHKGLLQTLKNQNNKEEDDNDQETEEPSQIIQEDLIPKFNKSDCLRPSVVSQRKESGETINSNTNNSSNVPEKKLVSEEQSHQYYEKSQQVIAEAFERYMLIKSLRYLDKEFRNKYEESLEYMLSKNTNSQHEEARKALVFMEVNTCSIEIINQRDVVQKVYFRIPPVTHYLSTITKTRFLESVNRDGSSEKLTGLLGQEKQFMDEMMHFLKLNALGIYFNLTYLSWARNLNLTIAFIINIFLLIDAFQTTDQGKTVSSIFQYINLGISAVVFAFWVVFEMPLELKEGTTRYDELVANTSIKEGQVGVHTFKGLVKVCMQQIQIFVLRVRFLLRAIILESHMVYLLVYFVFSLGGILWNNFFYSLLLLDIIQRSQTLQNVIKAVTKNGIQLIMTSVLGIVLVFIYAMIGYFTPSLNSTLILYADSTQPNICTNPMECFTVFLNQGLRSGGGIGDVLYQPTEDESGGVYITRFFFDLSFMIIIIIIMLNILFGIIIDTFGELRENRQAKDSDMRNKCFICNLERGEFENQRINFQKHLTREHNVWNYIYFLTHLRFKQISDFDGIESYVYSKYKKQDISWFPVGTSLKLQQSYAEDDDDDDDEPKNDQD